ncbi:MAG: RNB domain-containing ribonuclease, partial [Bacteroidia bacterium]|nr:RNB domain-containing ribonuclease [Bacteroidia bacterium]
MDRKKHRTKLLEADILKVLTEHKGRILNHKQIFSRLALEDMPRNAEDLLPILDQLVIDGSVGRRDKYKFFRLLPPVSLEGTIDITKNGRVFLMVDDQEEDLQVVQSQIRLLPFDKVSAVVIKQGKKTSKAEVISLISHSTRQFTGVLLLEHHHWYIQPDNNRFQFKFTVQHEPEFKVGKKVVFKIKEFRSDARFPSAQLIDILGNPGEHLTEMHAILAEFGLPEAFEPEVQHASDNISEFITDDDLKGREDYRKVLTFTIDPDTAKDFDDAISYQILDNGNLEVGVHIADVSHYVKPGSILDKEALKRATSVYLVDRVVPMLPFKLSDVVCSLVPNQDRLTCATIFEIDAQFNVINKRFVKAVIHSDKRFSYEEAQD